VPVASFTAIGQPVVIDVGASAYNPSGKPMIVDSYGQPAWGRVTWLGGTQFLYTPTAGYMGQADFTYTLRLKTPCELAEYTAAKQAPCALSQAAPADSARPGKGSVVVGSVAGGSVSSGQGAAATQEGTRLTLYPLSNASSPQGAKLALIGLQRRQGLLNVNDDGSLEYTPASGFSGVDVLTYTVSDGQGGVSTGYITVSVGGAPRPPLARTDVTTVAGNTPVAIAVLANDANRAGGPLTVTAVTQPVHGMAALNPDNTVTYTPDRYYAGADRFAYRVVNTQGLAGMGMAQVNVTRVNAPPTARDDQALALPDTLANMRVLANDDDPNGDALRIASARATTGTLQISPLDSLLYAPPPGFTGAVAISYTATDDDGGWASAQVSVTVAYATPRLWATDDVYAATLGRPIKLTLLKNDHTDVSVPLREVDVVPARNMHALKL
jgi:large repetitive protein